MITSHHAVIVKMIMKHNWDEAPHIVEVSPAAFACNPRDARVDRFHISISISATDHQPPPRQKGEAVVRPWLRKIRDGTGLRGREREQLDT